MSTEQTQQSEWNKAAYKLQAEMGDDNIQVKTVDEILKESAAGEINIDDLDAISEPLEIVLLREWLCELEGMTDDLPGQGCHYGWLVVDKVKNRLRDVVIELQIYLKEQESIKR
jgi:hypothetical protein